MTELFRTEQRRLGDLIPYEKNPRKITSARKHDLERMLAKYGMIGIAVLDADNTIVSGKQRCERLVEMGYADKIVDVRIAVRKLTDEERKEVVLIENNHWGEWDADILKEDYGQFLKDFDFGIDFAKLDAEVAEAAGVQETPEMPIVAKYSEKYDAIVIISTNEIDTNHLAEVLRLDTAKSYKSERVGMTKVITAKRFIEAWNARS